MQFKKIHLQKLQPREQPNTQKTTIDRLSSNICFSKSFADEGTLQTYIDTGIGQQRVAKPFSLFQSSYFFDAFYYAYTKHGDIVVVPDEIWIMISFYLSTYIDKNAQRLRRKLVKHDGVKTLRVSEQVIENSEVQEKKWDFFFDQIIKLIEEETVEGIVPLFQCDFTTTNKTYKMISTAIIMNTMKSFFKYERFMAGCGINNAYMAGERDDWVKLITKLHRLAEFDVDGGLKKYIEHMKVILQNFLNTFDGKPDVNWWNTVMLSPQTRQIYGGDEMEVEGWILHFFGKYKKVTMTGFPEYTVKVPIKIINDVTKKQKQMVLVSDWVSVSKLHNTAYKPDVGLAIFQLSEGQLKKEFKPMIHWEKPKPKVELLKINKINIGFFDSPTLKQHIVQGRPLIASKRL